MPSSNRRQFLGTGATAAVAAAWLATRSRAAEEAAQPKRQILAIGGGGLEIYDREHRLLKYLLSLTGKKNPLICYLPTASSDTADSIVAWYEVANRLDCRPRHLKLITNASNLKNLEQRILAMDAICVGGGNTRNMLSIWKTQGVDLLLRKAWEQGIVLSGSSAGMACWFEQCPADSMPGPPAVDNCLGLLKGTVCAHYSHIDRTGHKNYKEGFERLLLAGEIGDGYACEDNVALQFEDDKLVRIVSDRPKAKAYFVRKAGDNVTEEPLKVEYLAE